MEETQAKHLFDGLQQFASLSQTSICMLHLAEPGLPCPRSKYYCGNESVTLVINFDAVKEVYCQKYDIKDKWPSVDAVSLKDDLFLLIEIKSWQNFIRFQMKKNDNLQSIQTKIEKQVQHFKLQSKIDKSIEICKNVMSDSNLFVKVPSTYVLVTDIDTVQNPMDRFRAQLGVLSYNSVKYLLNVASTDAMNATDLKVRYVRCKEFDKFYESL